MKTIKLQKPNIDHDQLRRSMKLPSEIKFQWLQSAVEFSQEVIRSKKK